MNKIKLNFKVNEKSYQIETNPNRTLLDIIRSELNLTGTKEACNEGECGACTVIMNGKAVNSCLVIAGQINEAEILTIEGISNKNDIHSIQLAFLETGAIQCGYCIPGMIMSSKALLDNTPSPTEQQIRRALSGNICRCTGYTKIIEAVKLASEKLKK